MAKPVSDNRILRMLGAYVMRSYPYTAKIVKRESLGIKIYSTKAKIIRNPEEGNKLGLVRHGLISYPKNSKCRSGKTFWLYEAEEGKLFPLNVKKLIEDRELDVTSDEELTGVQARNRSALETYKPDKKGWMEKWGTFATMAVFFVFLFLYLWQFQGIARENMAAVNKNSELQKEMRQMDSKQMDMLVTISQNLAKAAGEEPVEGSGDEPTSPP